MHKFKFEKEIYSQNVFETFNNKQIFDELDHNKRILVLLINAYDQGLHKNNNINGMITLTVIKISGAYYI